MLTNYTDVNKMVQNIGTILQDIKKTIKADDRMFTVTGMTNRAIKVDVKTGSGKTVKADILPAVDLTQLSEYCVKRAKC